MMHQNGSRGILLWSLINSQRRRAVSTPARRLAEVIGEVQVHFGWRRGMEARQGPSQRRDFHRGEEGDAVLGRSCTDFPSRDLLDSTARRVPGGRALWRPGDSDDGSPSVVRRFASCGGEFFHGAARNVTIPRRAHLVARGFARLLRRLEFETFLGVGTFDHSVIYGSAVVVSAGRRH